MKREVFVQLQKRVEHAYHAWVARGGEKRDTAEKVAWRFSEKAKRDK